MRIKYKMVGTAVEEWDPDRFEGPAEKPKSVRTYTGSKVRWEGRCLLSTQLDMYVNVTTWPSTLPHTTVLPTPESANHSLIARMPNLIPKNIASKQGFGRA
jgi:hypothetical protein